MTDPPRELLGGLRPIPTYRDHPAATPRDVEGIDPAGTPRLVPVATSTEPVLVLFLSSGCAGCRDLWEGTAELRRALPAHVRLLIVTPDEGPEDRGAVARLAPADTDVVMSSRAYVDFKVAGPPFLSLVEEGQVCTEAVAWGVAETARAALAALHA